MTVVEKTTAPPTFQWPAGVHPAADLFPMMDAATFAAFAETIRTDGLDEAVWLTPEGLLLDGRNRVAACQLIGIEPKTRTYEGDDAVGFVMKRNVHRRQLTPSQRSIVALEALPLFAAQAAERQRTGKAPDLLAPGPEGLARTLGRTLRIIRDAYGDPGFVAPVIDGIGLLCQRYNGDLNEDEAIKKLHAAHGGVNGLLGKAENMRRQTGNYKSHCVAAAAVEVINTGRGGKKLPSWWKS